MRAGAALVVALHGGAVLAPARRGPEEVHLRGQELAREDVALGQAGVALDVDGRDDLPVDHEVSEAGEVALEHRLRHVTERLALRLPVAAGQLVRRGLGEAREDMPPRGRPGPG